MLEVEGGGVVWVVLEPPLLGLLVGVLDPPLGLLVLLELLLLLGVLTSTFIVLR